MQKPVCLIKCNHCKKQFRSPIQFDTPGPFFTSTIANNNARCRECGRMTRCNKENMYFNDRDGTIHHGDETIPEASPWDEEWIKDQRVAATPGWQRTKQPGLMEIRFTLDDPKPSKSHQELNQAAQKSEIRTFGWPIGVYLNNDESRPKHRADGIVAEIAEYKSRYDYWALRSNGDYYLLKTIFEDLSATNKLFVDTRIVRVTETLLYCAHLYTTLGVDPSTTVNIAIRHAGLVGRTLVMSSAAAHFPEPNTSIEDVSQVDIPSPLSELETNLVQLVKQVTAPLFVLFNCAEVPDSTYEKIVNDFVKGRTA